MRVIHLGLYPVKSLRGHAIDRSEMDLIGLRGDRRWMLVDENGVFLTARNFPIFNQINVRILPDGLELSHNAHGSATVRAPVAGARKVKVQVWRDNVMAALPDDSPAAEFVSTIVGRRVELVYQLSARSRAVDPAFGRDGEFTSLSDGFPVLLASNASLSDLNGRLGQPIPMACFRPNVVIDGCPPWAEDTWRRVRIGNTCYRVVKPCARCVVTTLDPETGEQTDPHEPLRTLASFHRSITGKIIFGQNMIPETRGTIAIGDSVEILDAGASNLL